MSSKNVSTTANAYNSASMSAYNSFMPQLKNNLTQMASNPLASSFFNQQYANGLINSQQATMRNNKNTLQNLKTGGGLLSNSSALTGSLLNRNMLAGSTMGSNAFNSALGGAMSNRNFALQSMQGFNPLQTGSTSTQYKTGAMQYVAPIAGAALNMVAPGLGSVLGGAKFSDGYN